MSPLASIVQKDAVEADCKVHLLHIALHRMGACTGWVVGGLLWQPERLTASLLTVAGVVVCT